MKIINTNDKEHDVLSIKKIVHQISDKVNNTTLDVEYVEVVINGKTRTWTEWIPLEDFKLKNPKIEI